jgi:hypothetical protein
MPQNGWKEVDDKITEGNDLWDRVEQMQKDLKDLQTKSTEALDEASRLIAAKAEVDGETPEVEAILYQTSIVGFELNYARSGITRYYYAFKEGLQDEKSKTSEKNVHDERRRNKDFRSSRGA